MRLLCLNTFRGILNRKIQLIGITFLIILSMTIYVGINSAIDGLESSYYDYLKKQNVEDISVYVNIDYSSDITVELLDDLRENQLANVSVNESYILDEYRNYLLDEKRIYDFVLINNVKNVFEYYGASEIIEARILTSLMDKYDFTYELEKSKIITNNGFITKILPYNEDGLNKTYLVDGRKPLNVDEVNILPGYAKSHNIEIGDILTIGSNDYEVVGYAYASDYIYPLLSVSMPIFDEESNNIVFMNHEAFSEFNVLDDNVYSIKYNYEVPRKFEMSLDEEMTDGVFNDEHIDADLNTVTRITRIGTLQLEFDSNRLFAKYFLYLFLIISVIVVLVVIKKQIDSDKLQIGILKSIGYSNTSIAFSYLLQPVLITIVGGLLGFIIGSIVVLPISNMLLSFYCIPLNDFSFSFDYLKCLMIPLFILSTLTYIFITFKLRKQNVMLLKDGSELKLSFFSKLLNKVFSFLPFESRFKYSLAFRFLSRILLISLISFCTGLLIVLILICSNLFSSVVDKSFDGVNYDYIVNLNGTLIDEIGDDLKSDYILSVNMNLVEIIDNDGNKRTVTDTNQFTFTGIDEDTKFIDILSDNEIINHELGNNNIIVNENIRESFDLKNGDTLKFMYGDIEFTYTIVNFNDEYTGYNVYISREDFSKDLGFNLPIYNSIYSNDVIYNNLSNLPEDDISKILDVISVDDLKCNMKKQMEGINSIVYPIIVCASIVVFIIISIIASVIVDENKKTISLMKVMGYSDKKISHIILNIYTSFIILSYFLSVPVMIKILKLIIKLLVNDISFTVPIVISWPMIIFGLLCLIISYYVALSFSKRSLRKVSMSVILKNE